MASAEQYPTNQKDDFFTILGNQFKLIGFSWEAFRLNFWTFAAVYLLPFVLLTVGVMMLIPDDLIKADGMINEAAVKDFLETINVTVATLASLGLVIVGSVLMLANIAIQLHSVQGKKLSLADAIEIAWPLLTRWLGLLLLGLLLIAAVVATFFTPIGWVFLLLAIVLCLPVAFFVSLALYIMVDKSAGPIESLKGSYRLVKQNWKIVLAYFVLSMVISIPSNMFGQFGSFIAFLLAVAYLCLPALLYLRITGQLPAKKTTAKSVNSGASQA